MTQETCEFKDIPLVSNPDLPVTRENLGLAPVADPGDIPVVPGKVEDYKFDLERQEYLQREEVQAQHTAYLEEHPELKAIVSDFLTSVLTDRPTNLYQYAADYFKGARRQ